MAANVQITYRDFDPPQLADERIRERIDRLENIHPRITACRVVAESPHRRHRKGTLYSFHIDLTLPGGELAVNRDRNDKHAHEDFFVAMRDAFNGMEEQLRTYSQRIKGKTKTHEVPLHGRVSNMFPDYGFIVDSEGAEIYFHANSVVDADFDDIEVGAEVRFVVAEGESDKGPQATTVRLIGKHHLP
jgi:cold shock CspA family protein/ribosome-associated translation inhibitor RaiA